MPALRLVSDTAAPLKMRMQYLDGATNRNDLVNLELLDKGNGGCLFDIRRLNSLPDYDGHRPPLQPFSYM